MIAQHYEFRVQGSLPRYLQTVFEPLRTEPEDDGAVTVIFGMIHDQSDLTGILEAIDNLGLQLIEVRPVGPPPRG